MYPQYYILSHDFLFHVKFYIPPPGMGEGILFVVFQVLDVCSLVGACFQKSVLQPSSA